MKVTVIIPTLNGGECWLKCINALLSQTCFPDKVLVLDSNSSDKTLYAAQDANFDVREINKIDFDHGATRQLAVELFSDYEIIIFLTQDAVLSDVCAIENILKPFSNPEVGSVCGRQLPRSSAGLIESHARIYNYSAQSYIRSLNDKKEYGLKTAFLSNSFAAYRCSTLHSVGGFPSSVIFGEDMYVAAKMLLAGYKVAYAADACVYHSHNYSMSQEMKRYFDMGVFHAREPWIRQELGGAEGEGMKFVVSEIKFLFNHSFLRIPEGMVRSLLRYTGFRLGLMEQKLPLSFKRALVMNKGYFK